MPKPTELIFWDYSEEILNRMRSGGILCTVADKAGKTNIITLGWGQIGPFYHGNPVFSIAVASPRYSWRFLEEENEFVIGLPTDEIQPAVNLCGSKSGRDLEKFAASGLTPVKSVHVKPPSVLECSINIECRIYARVQPPHMLLTPEHRQAPLAQQHTIYFAEVLGTYRWS